MTALLSLLLVGLSFLKAQNALEPLTVLAKRVPSDRADSTSAITILTAGELERMQENRLINGLNRVPGVQGLSTAGQTGNLGTALLRGLSTKYMQVVVDGVCLTDATNGASNFLGNAHLSGITRLEVLRGPQSVLYGSGAAGGVVGYETSLGQDDGYRLSAEAGNFGTMASSLLAQGTVGDLSYAVGLGRFETDNDPQGGLLRHDYQQDFGTLAFEWQAHDELTLRFSYRGSQNELQTVTDSGFGASPATIETETNLLALNAMLEVNPWWMSRVTLGHYNESYQADFNGFLVMTDYDRSSLNWTNIFDLNEQVQFQAGLEYARSDYRNLNGQDFDYRNFGAFINGVWKANSRFLLEGGVRYEDHSDFGEDLGWNLGGSYALNKVSRLRVRVAEAYRTPTLIDSQPFNPGFGPMQEANPNLEAEQIFGFEVGIDQEFGDGVLEFGYFHQSLENAIARGPVLAGSYQNVNLAGTTEVSGLEFALSGELEEGFDYRFAATRQFKEEMIDVPDLQISVDLSYQLDRLSTGLGLTYLDGASYGLANQTDSCALARIYGSYELNDSVTLYGRVENLFDREYLISDDGFLPIAGQGRSFIIGATVRW